MFLVKRLASLLLGLLVLLGPCSLGAGAEELQDPVEFNGTLEYTFSGGVLHFDPTENRIVKGVGLKGDVELPQTLGGAAVKSLGSFGANNPELTGLTLPEGLEMVEISSFSNCPKLKVIRFSSTAREFPGLAVGHGCPAVFQVSPENPFFTSDETGTLYSKDQSVLVRCPLETAAFTVPEGVRELGPGAFLECRKLTSLTLPNSLEVIGLDALSSCSALKSLRIPAGVTRIEDDFSGLNGKIEVDAENRAYSSDAQGALYDLAKAELIRFPGNASSAVIPEGVRSIGAGAFALCKMTSLTLPNSLETIGASAFNSCHGLKRIVLPEGVREIGDRAFSNCSPLERVDLPSSLQRIGDYVFSDNPDLRAVTLPGNLESMGECDFTNGQAVYYLPKGSPTERKAIEGGYPYRYGTPEEDPGGLPQPLAGTPYVDVDPQWEDGEAIRQIHALGLMKGMTPLTFQPGHPTTRAMLTAVLYRMEGCPETAGAESFPDVKAGSYYEQAAAWAKEKGILLGDRGRMAPNRTVTKGEAAAMVYRYLQSAGMTLPQKPGEASFGDRDEMKPWVCEAVDFLVAAGVIPEGQEYVPMGHEGDGLTVVENFFPQSRVTREQLAILLCALSESRESFEQNGWNPIP